METDAPITPRERQRRVVLLCVAFMRNLACHRAGNPYRRKWAQAAHTFNRDFWVTANGNSLDVAVLDWCKLLADPKDKHCWENVVSAPAQFRADLLAHLGMTTIEFDAYAKAMRHYRDKFLAHLDSDRTMHPPALDAAKAAVEFYFAHLSAREAQPGDLNNLPATPDELATYYEKMASEAARIYGQSAE